MPQEKPHGLTGSQVAEARQRFGWNELPRQKPPSRIAVFLRQFKSLLIAILIAAACIAFVLGEAIDALAISLVLLLNAVLGFLQEWRAETALEALRSMLSPTSVVVRDGEEVVIPSREIVPGDLVIVATGAVVPADLRLVAGAQIRADESVLTGESVPVEKSVGATEAAGTLYAGTLLVEGRAEGEVSAIGTQTAFGGIATLTTFVDRKETHLQRRLSELAKWLGTLSIAIAAAVAGIGIWVGREPFEMFMTGLSLAVAMVPEGLPAVVTATLALGASAMARRNALARRLQAVETLGAASVICTDKTGTLTENQMTATQLWTLDRTFDVTGSGYDPTGHIAFDGKRLRAKDDVLLGRVMQVALLCNHATLTRVGDDWHMIGSPTEGALITLAMKAWAPFPDENSRLTEHPFSSERKRMSVMAQTEDGLIFAVKGAPEMILSLCTEVQTQAGPRTITEDDRAAFQTALNDMAAKGQRVIALAMRVPQDETDLSEERLTLLGLVGLNDPPRPEIRGAIELAHSAGIRTVMITGDNPLTARAIATQIGLGTPTAILGSDLEDMDDAALVEALKGNVLFARTKPEHKIRIVAALQSLGHIVAMTGDGVNDAPALKRADIGVVMGIRGTDVSKSVADLVLLDDNFSTIVNAIAEGRRQFENVKKFVHYLLCSNAGEVVAIVVNLLLGGPLIFLATQILWMNLITDSVTAVALGLEKGERAQMARPPRRGGASIIDRQGVGLIAVFGLYTGSASLWIFYTFLPLGPDVARTAAFTGMVIFEKVSVFAFRSLTQPNWKIGWLSNPILIAALVASIGAQGLAVYWAPLQTLLQTVPIGVDQWTMIVMLALPILVVPEVVKSVMGRTVAPGHQAAR